MFYAPVTSVGFDYSAESWDVVNEREFTSKVNNESLIPLSVLIEYDITSGMRRELGTMETEDGRKIFGLGAAVCSPIDNKLYFAGAVEEKDPKYVAGQIDMKWNYSMALFSLPVPTE